MFRRSRPHGKKQQPASLAGPRSAEIDQLKLRITRLERTLDDLLSQRSASPGTRGEGATLARRSRRTSTAFADAWKMSESPDPDSDDFFDLSHIDQRARSWLLTKK